ncbi:MAG: PocR ligand-binding domain-containing protein, partial [Longicatena sp.]
MENKAIVKMALDDYYRISGLRSYMVLDNEKIQSASEKNYFCKCLKISSKALKKCEECMKETYSHARSIEKECIYSCHAGLIKWALPFNQDNFHCVIVSEGILGAKQ